MNKEFLKFIKENPELQEKLKALPKDTPKEDIVDLANAHGFTLTVADLTPPEISEISDEELVAVVGGSVNCGCWGGGGGGGTSLLDGETVGCACVLYGQGGDGKERHMYCVCGWFGLGDDDFNESHS